nr:PREDICTED: pleckstrin homology domain-containing family A member 7-like [Lepisosteus oculatus]
MLWFFKSRWDRVGSVGCQGASRRRDSCAQVESHTVGLADRAGEIGERWGLSDSAAEIRPHRAVCQSLLRMSEADRLSQASSVATVSSLPAGSKASVSKVHSFGKRGLSVKRDPNCPVIIRGWLYKQDSSGLKLWKRRWFVLSDYCLFYYRG